MVADCVAAVAWCHARGAELGLSRTWVSGGASSGATLAAMAAHRCAPPPAAFVSVYGLVDTVHYLDDEKVRPVLDEPYIACSAAEIAALMRDRNPANASVQNPWASEFPPAVSIEECRAALGMPHWAPGDEHRRRVDMYTYVARERNLMDIIYRREAFGSEEAYRAHVARNSPHHLLDGTASFPPTFFMHGDQDAIVPTAQSTNMARRLREMGVPHQVHYEKGAGHVYDFAFEVRPARETRWYRLHRSKRREG
jgi:acetyl esterase/lipase